VKKVLFKKNMRLIVEVSLLGIFCLLLGNDAASQVTVSMDQVDTYKFFNKTRVVK